MKESSIMPTMGAILLASFVLMAGSYLGLSRWLGAHPFWQFQVAWIGLGMGVVIALGLGFGRVNFKVSAGISLILLSVSLTAAYIGKTRFAASYAEDHLAGKFWYFGSMAVAAALFVCLFVGLHRLLSRRAVQ